MNLETQWATLLWMLASGGIMGIAFDSYRVVSGQLRFPRWSVHTLDLLYWLAAALFVFRTLYHSNHGELRFYVFLGLFLGIWIYFLFLSVITERFVLMLMRIVNSIYRFIIRMIGIFIIAPLRWLVKVVRILLGFIWIVLLFMGRVTLLPIWRLFVWALRPIWTRLRVPQGWDKIRRWAAVWWERVLRLLRWFNKE
ncbi:spore cortex biosynthesis protein YabQ [Paenibacillus sp. DXFW5]|uniref:Spore cortex biosynthesis protein YabQ n=1 Tax=Paenibacillus rhizolycopersici TaxID=2780073 RepID=A0ABS2HA76_9BACL|nr:spore cortex biosynthesis protein YabQ [Paenibacillus rhizolycopersici]MBM6998292.1 spore cortex biosynthesis protein YabQ [Paenibacillus rhizolycopersici]